MKAHFMTAISVYFFCASLIAGDGRLSPNPLYAHSGINAAVEAHFATSTVVTPYQDITPLLKSAMLRGW